MTATVGGDHRNTKQPNEFSYISDSRLRFYGTPFSLHHLTDITVGTCPLKQVVFSFALKLDVRTTHEKSDEL